MYKGIIESKTRFDKFAIIHATAIYLSIWNSFMENLTHIYLLRSNTSSNEDEQFESTIGCNDWVNETPWAHSTYLTQVTFRTNEIGIVKKILVKVNELVLN